MFVGLTSATVFALFGGFICWLVRWLLWLLFDVVFLFDIALHVIGLWVLVSCCAYAD